MSDVEKKVLTLYPIRNHAFEMKEGKAVITVKKELPKLIKKTFLKWLFTESYKVDLDEKGTFVWILCDGKKNVTEIMKLAEDEFPDEKNTVSERVKLFITQLNRQRLITFYEKTGDLS